jgi:hypothetical protein
MHLQGVMNTQGARDIESIVKKFDFAGAQSDRIRPEIKLGKAN